MTTSNGLPIAAEERVVKKKRRLFFFLRTLQVLEDKVDEQLLVNLAVDKLARNVVEHGASLFG